jgi:hypothetical protein
MQGVQTAYWLKSRGCDRKRHLSRWKITVVALTAGQRR